MPAIIVIGAGVIGTSVAYRLAKAGAKVTVLEATRVGGGTSGASFAWTNSNGKTPRPYHDLNVAGMRAHAALKDEFGSIPWWHGGGRVEWRGEENQAALKDKVSRLQAWDYNAQWIAPSDLHELEPDIDLRTVGDEPIAYYPEDGWLDTIVYAHAMMSAARKHGATLHCGVRVSQLALSGNKVTGVKTTAGETYSADMVVNCTGRWSNEPLGKPELAIPLAPTVGFLVFTPPVPASISRVVATPVCDFRPDGAGRLMIHWGPADATINPDLSAHPGMEEARAIVKKLVEILPGIGPVEPEAVRATIRPIPGDGLSAVGGIPDVDGYYLVVTHSGATLSPALAHLVSDEIMNGNKRNELADFRPARFFANKSQRPVG